MSKQLHIHSKSRKETQEEAVKQAQSQQYRHQSDIIDITLLPPFLTLYPFHTPLPSPHRLQPDQCRHSRYLLALEIKQNLRILTVKSISHSQTKLTCPKFDTKSLLSLQPHLSGFHLLILFLNSSRFFKFFISIGTIC